jgi:hypothetical protein
MVNLVQCIATMQQQSSQRLTKPCSHRQSIPNSRPSVQKNRIGDTQPAQSHEGAWERPRKFSMKPRGDNTSYQIQFGGEMKQKLK